MDHPTTRHPLAWPSSWPRTAPAERRPARFSKVETRYNGSSSYRSSGALTVGQALARLWAELERLGARGAVVSRNVEFNVYGQRTRRDSSDPGVAVYFELEGKDRVLACDRWLRTADNLASIAAHIDCLRGIERYGVGTLAQAFTGYDALPAPGADNRPAWRRVLGIAGDVTAETILSRFRELAKECHPDMPRGSHEAMAILNAARAEALAELER